MDHVYSYSARNGLAGFIGQFEAGVYFSPRHPIQYLRSAYPGNIQLSAGSHSLPDLEYLKPGTKLRYGFSAAGSVQAGYQYVGILPPLTEAASTGLNQTVKVKVEMIPVETSIELKQIRNLSDVSNQLAHVDSALEPLPDASVLKNLPQVIEGLVADGVTPLVISLTGAHAGKSNVNFQYDNSLLSDLSLNDRVMALDVPGAPWKKTKSSEPNELGEVYFYLPAIKSEELRFPPGTNEISVTMVLSGGWGEKALVFKIRKPPIVLVHGYNTAGAWTPDFLATVRGPVPPVTPPLISYDFVKPIVYGVGTGETEQERFWINSYGALGNLAYILSATLWREIEDPNGALKKAWAFTRYDAVGHSQGGVLLRMLSSKGSQVETTPSFRKESNFYRGRFRRIVTIGSPHNGSTLVRYLLQLSKEEGMFGNIVGSSRVDLQACKLEYSIVSPK